MSAAVEKPQAYPHPHVNEAWLAKLREEVEMAKGLCPPFDQEAYREGHLTPVYFGSALNNFGVRELLAGVAPVVPPFRIGLGPPRIDPDRRRKIGKRGRLL